MIRLLSWILVPVLLAGGGLYLAYGQIEPCRVLAVERARRAEAATNIPLGGIIERWTHTETATLSERECASDLLDSWGERLSKYFP